MKTLIIVDVQNDFLPNGALAVEKGDEIISFINAIQRNYDLIVATQDWHPQTHKSFASQHLHAEVMDVIQLNGLEQVLWPDHCVQGSFGAQFSDQLSMERVEMIVRKGMDERIDSYSGFFDNGRQKNTGLHGFLKDRNVTEVHFCGLAADYCVYYSAMDALDLGYKSFILSKGTRPIEKSTYMEKKEKFLKRGGVLI